MSSKISDLTIAIDSEENDVFTFVRSGINYQTTLSTTWIPKALNPRRFGATDGALIVDYLGQVSVGLTTSGNFQVDVNSQLWMNISWSNGIIIGYVTPIPVKVMTTGGTFAFEVDTSGNTFLRTGNGASVSVGYTVAAAGNWSGSPTDLATAVDRLAAAVAGLLAGPIP